MVRQLHSCIEQLQGRGFLMRHCGAETRLALAACDWAAEKSQVSAISQQMSGLSPRQLMPSRQTAPGTLSCCSCATAYDLRLPPLRNVVLQGRDIGRLVEMAATLEEAALREWLSSFSNSREALKSEGLPEFMLSDLQRQLSSQPGL